MKLFKRKVTKEAYDLEVIRRQIVERMFEEYKDEAIGLFLDLEKENSALKRELAKAKEQK